MPGRAPDPVAGELPVPLPHRLPWPERFARQVAPWDPGPKSVSNPLHHDVVITERATHLARIRGKQRLDPRSDSRP